MNLGLENKVALVTAASEGIGFGSAKALAEEGCKLVICSRRKDAIEQARDNIFGETRNNKILALEADITRDDDIEKLVNLGKKEFGEIDILVYNTGSPRVAPFLDLTNEDWDQGVKLLLMNAVWLSSRLIPSMVEKKWGRLVFITSMTLKQPIPNLVLSNVIRLSIGGLSKNLSQEFGSHGITSNVILQGNILTKRQKQVTADFAKRRGVSFEDAERARLAEVPAGRFGTIDEIGKAVVFLASNQASYINGASLLIDGGLVKSVL